MNSSLTEIYSDGAVEYEMSIAEAVSLELQRDSRRYSADFEREAG